MFKLLRVLSWLALRAGVYLWWSKTYQRLAERGDRGIVLPKFDTIEELTAVVAAMRWRKDSWRMLWDAISDPRATWARHIAGKAAGDCDDISFFIVDRVTEMVRRGILPEGVRAYLLTVSWYDRKGKKKAGGHNVAAISYPFGDFTRWAHASNWLGGRWQHGDAGGSPSFVLIEDLVVNVLQMKGLTKRDLLGFLQTDCDMRAVRYGNQRDLEDEDLLDLDLDG